MAGAEQMGRRWDLPTSSIGGIADAKRLDAQYRAEKTLAVTMAAHAGSNIITQAAGMMSSLLGVSHAGLLASGSLRIESGIRGFGHELTPGTTPQEAGLGAFCAFGTGFVGEEASRGHTPVRRIVSLLFDDPDAIPIHDEPIYCDGRVVGKITSAAWSHRFGRSVALEMVNAPLERVIEQDVVTRFEVEIVCMRYAAKCSLNPAKEAF